MRPTKQPVPAAPLSAEAAVSVRNARVPDRRRAVPGSTRERQPAATGGTDRTHPNAERWQRAVDAAELRGSLVADILQQHMTLEGAMILDLGCGIGGSAAVLYDRGAHVMAADLKLDRLRTAARRRRAEPGAGASPSPVTARVFHAPLALQATAACLPLAASSLDAVVLQDMLEHVEEPDAVLAEVQRVLRPGGLLYLSTPNRFSPVNLLADPHFGLPVVAGLGRPTLRRVLRLLRPSEAGRGDLAGLLSWTALESMLSRRFILLSHETPAVIRRLFSAPEAVVWSRLHLNIVRLLRRSGLARPLQRRMSGQPGVLVRTLLPTWYLVLRKGAP